MNQVAPEHLEIAMDNAYDYLDAIEMRVLFSLGISRVNQSVIITQGQIIFCQQLAQAVSHQR